MKTDDSMIEEVIRRALEAGIRIDAAYALRYLRARGDLAAHKNIAAAKEIVGHFEMLMSSGGFVMPFEDWEKYCNGVDDEYTFYVDTATGRVRCTHFTNQEDAERAVKLCQRYERQPVPRHIVEKCWPVYRRSDEFWPGGYEGIYGFLDRTSLTLDQIEKMSTQELQAYA